MVLQLLHYRVALVEEAEDKEKAQFTRIEPFLYLLQNAD